MSIHPTLIRRLGEERARELLELASDLTPFMRLHCCADHQRARETLVVVLREGHQRGEDPASWPEIAAAIGTASHGTVMGIYRRVLDRRAGHIRPKPEPKPKRERRTLPTCEIPGGWEWRDGMWHRPSRERRYRKREVVSIKRAASPIPPRQSEP